MVVGTKLLIDVAACEALDILEPTSKKTVPQDDRDNEAETTDVGSADSSDAESTASISSIATNSCLVQGCLARVCFSTWRSTLETIPGTPVESSSLEHSIGVSVLKSPVSKEVLLKEQVSDCNAYSADESDLETARPLMEVFDQNFGGQAVPLPPPRSPKRRSQYPSSEKSAVNAASMNPFCTVPVACSTKKRSRDAATAIQAVCPIVASVMYGQLETIPVKPCRRSYKNGIQSATALAVNSDSAVSASGLSKSVYGTIPAPASDSPKPGVGARFADARRERIPVKVDLSWSLEASLRKPLDRTLPAKKKPVFAEIAGTEADAALHCFEPDMPVKKRVPSFLLEEPRLVRMAR